MTDEPNDTQDEQTFEQVDADFLLQALVATAAEKEFELGLTLNIPGGMVTGVLISGVKYWKEIGAEHEQIKVSIAEPFLKIFEREAADVAAQGSRDPGTYTSIHLRNAYFFLGDGTRVPSNGMFWRGRLSEVAGWTIGTIST